MAEKGFEEADKFAFFLLQEFKLKFKAITFPVEQPRLDAIHFRIAAEIRTYRSMRPEANPALGLTVGLCTLLQDLIDTRSPAWSMGVFGQISDMVREHVSRIIEGGA